MIRRQLRNNLWIFLAFAFFPVPKTYGGMVSHEFFIQNHHCWVIEPPDLPSNAPVVFLLHGLGGKADRFKSECDDLSLPPCRFVVPDAPIPWIPWHLGLVHKIAGDILPRAWNPFGFAWYASRGDRESTVKSRDYLFNLMEQFSIDTPMNGVNPKPRPIIMAGFSQGAVMALEAGLNYKGNVRAIISLSGYIWDPSQTLKHPALPLYTPILMLHGKTDKVVDENLNQRAYKALKKAGYHPILKELSMGHEVNGEELAEVSSFLNSIKK